MKEIIDVNGFEIEKDKVNEIVQEIIKILKEKNITYAIAYMILDEIKDSLNNNIIR